MIRKLRERYTDLVVTEGYNATEAGFILLRSFMTGFFIIFAMLIMVCVSILRGGKV
ncbi:unknown [Clostridium sp. CAG:149]|nr:unknown [Clostridium sp. CAG:149]